MCAVVYPTLDVCLEPSVCHQDVTNLFDKYYLIGKMFYWAYTELISRLHSQEVSTLDRATHKMNISHK